MIKAFFAFVRKEWYHITRDKRTLLILFGMPVVQVILFGFAISTEVRNAPIGILDLSHSDLSGRLIQKLETSDYFDITRTFSHPSQFDPAFRKGEIRLALTIPANLGEVPFTASVPAFQLIADGTEPNSATTLVNYFQAILAELADDLGKGRFPANPIPVDIRMVYNPSLKSVYLFVPGVMAFILLLVSAMMTALTIAREKETGTMELLLVSPLNPALIILGKVSPYILLAFLNGISILGIGIFVFGVPVKGSLVLLLALCVFFILCCLSLGIFISTRSKSQQEAMMASLLILMMPTMLLSGFIFPIDSMPMALQFISHIIPAKYFIVILKQVMLKGTGVELIFLEIAVLGGMTLLFLLLSYKNFNVRLEP